MSEAEFLITRHFHSPTAKRDGGHVKSPSWLETDTSPLTGWSDSVGSVRFSPFNWGIVKEQSRVYCHFIVLLLSLVGHHFIYELCSFQTSHLHAVVCWKQAGQVPTSDINTCWMVWSSVSLYSSFLTDVFEFVFNKNAFKTLLEHVGVYRTSLQVTRGKVTSEQPERPPKYCKTGKNSPKKRLWELRRLFESGRVWPSDFHGSVKPLTWSRKKWNEQSLMKLPSSLLIFAVCYSEPPWPVFHFCMFTTIMEEMNVYLFFEVAVASLRLNATVPWLIS